MVSVVWVWMTVLSTVAAWDAACTVFLSHSRFLSEEPLCAPFESLSIPDWSPNSNSSVVLDGFVRWSTLESPVKCSMTRRRHGTNQLFRCFGESEWIFLQLTFIRGTNQGFLQIQHEWAEEPYSRRKLQDTVETFPECFPGRQGRLYSVKVGFAVDDSFLDEFGGDTELAKEYISWIITDASGIYESQLAIQLRLGDILFGDELGNMSDCSNQGSDKTDQLQMFEEWNEEYASSLEASDEHAVWVLLSSCHSGARAETRVLCRNDKYNSMVVNYHGSGTWLTFAHEMGHVIGADHSFENGTGSTGGIMDYGDGTVHGLYQFNQLRRQELCEGIQWSLQESRVPNCWSVVHAQQSSLVYSWHQSGEYDFSQLCGVNTNSEEEFHPFQYAPEILDCAATDRNGNRTIVGNEFCDPTLKPLTKFVQCRSEDESESKEEWNQCGDGFLDMSEECDDESDPCCDTSICQRISSSEHCNLTDATIDAAFSDSFGRIIVFKGDSWVRYTLSDEGDLVPSSDPRSISDTFALSAWDGDFDGTFCTQDFIVFVFRDFSYVRLDLTASWSDAQLDEHPVPLTSDSIFGQIPDEFLHCGRIDAVIQLSVSRIALVCGNVYFRFDLSSEQTYNSISDLWRPFDLDYPLVFSDYLSRRLSLDAGFLDWNTGVVHLVRHTEYVSVKQQRQLSRGSYRMLPFAYHEISGGSDSCLDQFCDFCDSETPSVCLICSYGYRLFNDQCYHASYLLLLDFEDISRVTDSEVNRDVVFSATNSLFGAQSLEMSSSTFLQLLPLCNWEANDEDTVVRVQDWLLSFYVFPSRVDQNSNDTSLMSFEHENGEVLELRFTQLSHCDSLGITLIKLNQTTKVESPVFAPQWCPLSLTFNAWNKVSLNVSDTSMVLSVNGYSSSGDFSVESTIGRIIPSHNFELEIYQWYIGSKTKPTLTGFMDHLVFQAGDQFTLTQDFNHSSNQSTDGGDSGTQTSAACFPIGWTTLYTVTGISVVFYTLFILSVAVALQNRKQITEHIRRSSVVKLVRRLSQVGGAMPTADLPWPSADNSTEESSEESGVDGDQPDGSDPERHAKISDDLAGFSPESEPKIVNVLLSEL